MAPVVVAVLVAVGSLCGIAQAAHCFVEEDVVVTVVAAAAAL